MHTISMYTWLTAGLLIVLPIFLLLSSFVCAAQPSINQQLDNPAIKVDIEQEVEPLGNIFWLGDTSSFIPTNNSLFKFPILCVSHVRFTAFEKQPYTVTVIETETDLQAIFFWLSFDPFLVTIIFLLTNTWRFFGFMCVLVKYFILLFHSLHEHFNFLSNHPCYSTLLSNILVCNWDSGLLCLTHGIMAWNCNSCWEMEWEVRRQHSVKAHLFSITPWFFLLLFLH